MWIRFETASEGLRALGAISRIGRTEDASFSSDGEFHEAATYSRDLWSLETEDSSWERPLHRCELGVIASPADPAYPASSASAVSPTSDACPASAVNPASSMGHAKRRRVLLVETTLEDHLSDAPPVPLTSLAQRLLSKLSLEDRLSDAPPVPLRLSCSAPPLASRISEAEEPPSKRQKLAAMTSPAPPVAPSPSPSASPSKRKRRGNRAGRLVKEQRATCEKHKAEAEALAAQAEATGDSTLLEWIPTLAVVAEEEAREMEEIDGAAGWSHEGDDDDDPPIAGPSRLR
ncbi:hypothetical protein DFH09DRAFT_1071732 [Mycena vulgaris]|nr:hypothetical protein DFH09DRAFT_1071732 [Mycena vulgaris]